MQRLIMLTTFTGGTQYNTIQGKVYIIITQDKVNDPSDQLSFFGLVKKNMRFWVKILITFLPLSNKFYIFHV